LGEGGSGAKVRVRVEGRVQGVGFRWYTRDCAVVLGLTGFVKNLPDGAVEAIAEGSVVALSTWVAQVRRGPPMGRVLSCSVQQSTEATREYDDFAILH